MMTRHLQVELERLKKRLLSLGAMVEEAVRLAIEAMQARDPDLACKIIKNDSIINQTEVEIEEDCLKILALHQPVAVDLRFIAAVIKINNDLERIGDEAVNIAERVKIITKRPPAPINIDYTMMAEKAEAMLKMALDALVSLDVDSAYKICLMDDEVDRLNGEFYDKIKDAIKSIPERAGALINLLLIGRHLERIADHATNIAEEVIYMIEGEIPRHRNFQC
jgi:phosphate transport system protein